MTKKQKVILMVAILVVAAIWLYTSLSQKAKRGAQGQDGIPDQDGYYYFQYAGGSALRDEGGVMPDCNNVAGEPSPTNFFAFLEIGKYENGVFTAFPTANCTEDDLCRILPGDSIQGVEVLQGQNNSNLPFDGNSFEVLQIGTDLCTPNNDIAYFRNGILIDLIVESEGAFDPIYQATGQVVGRFKLSQQA